MTLVLKFFPAAFLISLLFSSFTTFLPSEIGNATIIDDALHKKIMACEVEYDKSQNVAAHKTLPCGSKVRVTVLSTNKSIELTIVDRGPYLQGQIIAISSNAAAVLGISAETRVKVEPLDAKKSTEKTAKKTTKNTVKKESGLNIIQEAADIEKGGLYKMQVMKLEPKGWGVQVAAYSNYEAVIKQLSVLQNNWFKGGLVYADQSEGKASYKIIMGPFFTKEEADSYCSSIKEKYKVKDAFVLDLNAIKATGK
jgi:rare lipoprotein A